MLWLGGFHALDLTTSTPDALCPPLEETRAAVKARVGEVRGDYRAEFALIRASSGQSALELVLREKEQEVLRRELPLDDAGCDDAAQAIALVLERFFDAIERRPEETTPPAERAPSVTSTTSQVAPPTPAARRRTTPLPVDHAWQARAGFVYDLKLGLGATLGGAYYPSGFRLAPHVRIGVALDITPFVTRWVETVREEHITATTLQSALSIPVTVQLSRWSLTMGPWAELRLQRAEAPTLQHDRATYRVLPGFGGFAQLGWALAPSWSVGAGVALGAQLSSAASRFVLLRDGDQRNEVLVPGPWLGQGQLVLAFNP